MTVNAPILKAPFPYAGGKSRIAADVWQRLGDVDNYVEPFCGSLATLLRRPADHFRNGYRVETVNDANHYLCLGPDTRILRADLTWSKASEIAEGDVLMGFDEFNGEHRPDSRAPSSYRKWRTTTVTGVARTVKPCYRLTFTDGTIVMASADHQWLAGASGSGQGGWKWQTTEQLQVGGVRSNVLKLCYVAEKEESWEAGWLGGLLDGEGSVSAKAGWRLCLAQNPGVTLERAEAYLTARGFYYSRLDRAKGCSVLLLAGGMREVLRLLMTVRPERLIKNALGKIEKFSLYGREHNAVGLVSKEYIGDQEVIAISTDRRTFIAEGLASHNCNFWRAVKADPEAVAEYADWPVMEADLHARHKWLVRSPHAAEWRKKMAEDPEHYDAKMAGWWCWGACCWIGGMWCADGGIQHDRRPAFSFNNLGSGVRGNDPSMTEGRPQLTDAFDIGRGVNSGGSTDWTQVPDLANSRTRGGETDCLKRPVFHDGGITRGVCGHRRAWLTDWMRRLSDRLRLVRTCYGHWSRICDSDSTMTRLGTTGVFLDPPYPAKRADGTKSRDDSLYVNDKLQCLDALRDEVLAWCRKWAGPQVRIAVCGYEGDGYEALVAEGWTEQSWEAGGGYANQRRGGKGKSENAKRERVWYSPACVAESGLFSSVA